MSALRPCPLCASSASRPLHTQHFALEPNHPLPPSYDVVACAACGFCYAATSAPQSVYDAYYSAQTKYEDPTTGSGGGYTPWDLERLDQLAALLLAWRVPPSARLLDLGCASGGLLRALRARGFARLAGLDPSPVCAAHVAHSGFEAFTGSLFAIPHAAGQFDLIVLSHVLEHVVDLRGALAALRPALAPNALLYLEVPDPVRYLDFLYAPFQDFNLEHINHFSHASLARLAASAGLVEIERTTRLLHASENCLYPALSALYRLAPEAAPTLEIDTRTEPALHSYIAASQAQIARMDARLRAALQTHGRLLLWGSGQLALKLFHDTVLRTAPVPCVLDGNPANAGKHLHGIPILSPAQLTDFETPIVIASTLHESAIRARIAALGWPNPLVSLAD